MALISKRNKCLLVLFLRGELHQVAVDKWPVVSDDIRQQMARMAAAAAWGLGKTLLNYCEGRKVPILLI